MSLKNMVLLQAAMAWGFGFLLLGGAIVILYIIKTLCKWSLSDVPKGTEKRYQLELAYNISRVLFYVLLIVLLILLLTVDWSNT